MSNQEKHKYLQKPKEHVDNINKTRRERLKSAPYLRLKKRKTSKAPKSRMVPKNVERGPSGIY